MRLLIDCIPSLAHVSQECQTSCFLWSAHTNTAGKHTSVTLTLLPTPTQSEAHQYIQTNDNLKRTNTVRKLKQTNSPTHSKFKSAFCSVNLLSNIELLMFEDVSVWAPTIFQQYSMLYALCRRSGLNPSSPLSGFFFHEPSSVSLRCRGMIVPQIFV